MNVCFAHPFKGKTYLVSNFNNYESIFKPSKLYFICFFAESGVLMFSLMLFVCLFDCPSIPQVRCGKMPGSRAQGLRLSVEQVLIIILVLSLYKSAICDISPPEGTPELFIKGGQFLPGPRCT